MEISLDSLVSIDKLEKDIPSVLQVVENRGHAVLLKDNKPAYIIIKYVEGIELPGKTVSTRKSDYTLQEAMKIVLMEQEEKIMHAAALADVIYERGLYYKKNGDKARYNQIRARANNYPDMFEALQGNIIKLTKE